MLTTNQPTAMTQTTMPEKLLLILLWSTLLGMTQPLPLKWLKALYPLMTTILITW
jgi:hypothetical protein